MWILPITYDRNFYLIQKMETPKEELKKLEIFVKGIALKLKQRLWLYGLYVQILKKINSNGWNP